MFWIKEAEFSKDEIKSFFEAIGEKNLRIVQQYLKSGMDPNIRDIDGLTPLMWAAYHGSRLMVGILLDHNANPILKDLNGKNALAYNEENDNAITYPMIKELIQNKINMLMDKEAEQDSYFFS